MKHGPNAILHSHELKDRNSVQLISWKPESLHNMKQMEPFLAARNILLFGFFGLVPKTIIFISTCLVDLLPHMELPSLVNNWIPDVSLIINLNISSWHKHLIMTGTRASRRIALMENWQKLVSSRFTLRYTETFAKNLNKGKKTSHDMMKCNQKSFADLFFESM